MGCKTTLIAEIGENHLGNMDLARRMVVTAADHGAHIVKFQSFHGEDTAPDDREREWFKQVELSDELHFELKKLAEDRGVRFLSSPFNVERTRFLVERVGLTQIKVASGTMRHLPILAYLNSRADVVDTVYMSTGMATLDEIRDSLSRLKDIRRVIVMHCVASYPAEDEDANLRAIATLQREFPEHEIGYSDHTRGIEACLAAVALGATVLEKHFTFNVLMPGDDHAGGMTPQDEAELVARLERLENMLGTGQKVPGPKERQMQRIMRNRFGQ
jgi:sialic acid synthase SpsE